MSSLGPTTPSAIQAASARHCKTASVSSCISQGPTAHPSQLSFWIHAVNSFNDLCNKALWIHPYFSTDAFSAFGYPQAKIVSLIYFAEHMHSHKVDLLNACPVACRPVSTKMPLVQCCPQRWSNKSDWRKGNRRHQNETLEIRAVDDLNAAEFIRIEVS